MTTASIKTYKDLIVKMLPFGKLLAFQETDDILNQTMRMLNKMIASLQATS